MRLFSHPELAGVRRISRHAAGNVSRLRAIRLAIAANDFKASSVARPLQPRPLIGREIIEDAAALSDNAAAPSGDLFFAGSEPENKP
jgi:hypothetical protein